MWKVLYSCCPVKYIEWGDQSIIRRNYILQQDNSIQLNCRLDFIYFPLILIQVRRAVAFSGRRARDGPLSVDKRPTAGPVDKGDSDWLAQDKIDDSHVCLSPTLPHSAVTSLSTRLYLPPTSKRPECGLIRTKKPQNRLFFFNICILLQVNNESAVATTKKKGGKFKNNNIENFKTIRQCRFLYLTQGLYFEIYH